MSRIKGAAISARLDYIRDTYGQESLDRVVASLEDMDQIILSGSVLPSIWYPFQVLVNLDEATSKLLCDGEDSLFEAAGEHVARQHARSIYRVFFRETDPGKVLRLASSIFANYYSGLGRLSLVEGGLNGTERLVMSDCSGTSRSYCLSSMAYFRTVLESCCDHGVSVREVRCQAWGDDACEYDFAWQTALSPAVGE